MLRKSASPVPERSRKILAFRQSLKLTQSELSKRLKTSAMAVSRWERGSAEPPAEAYIRLGNISIALIRLRRSATEIKLEVSDDGKGMNREIQSRFSSGDTAGVGLRGMRERVKQLGGSIEIQSNGKGTTVTATLPLAASGEAAFHARMMDVSRTSPRSEGNADLATATVPELASTRRAGKA
jgi:transcriptional regulator with XRE-family HTH domain